MHYEATFPKTTVPKNPQRRAEGSSNGPWTTSITERQMPDFSRDDHIMVGLQIFSISI